MDIKTIFVSVASYRDFYCSKTLESIYLNATNPQNIYVGLCIQNTEGDEDCLLKDKAIKKYSPNISTIRMKNYEAKGPTWARYLCTTLFNNQDYFFQIDSHTLFEKGWDTKCIEMVEDIKKNTGSTDVVLSHYPPSYEEYQNKEKNLKSVDTICQSFFNDRGMVSFLGASPVDMDKDKYVQTPHIAAGMFFCEGKCLKEVPYDPQLPNLFVGEEILHSARVWTSGYDIYSPTEVVVYHLYTRSDQPHIWDDKDFNDTDAFNKVKFLMEMDKNVKIPAHLKENIDKYGMGTKRTLKEYYDFAGIDLKKKKIYKNFCPKPHEITPVGEEDIKKGKDANNEPASEPGKKDTTTEAHGNAPAGDASAGDAPAGDAPAGDATIESFSNMSNLQGSPFNMVQPKVNTYKIISFLFIVFIILVIIYMILNL